MLTNNDTIAAIATPPGTGGVGIIRLSGEDAPQILERLFRRYQASEPWQSHRLYLGQISDPQSGQLLDQALAVLMRAPHSYTREQVAELHCHGGPQVLAQVLAACVAAGARLAGPGEFTLRAFLNGALSLDEAEAVADLVAAQTSTQARLALGQLAGGLSARLAPLEAELLALLAELTAALDFPEEVAAPSEATLLPRLAALRAQAQELLAGAEAGRIFREGLSVVLAGATNVGKSSLLNRLLAQERAIVTARPGTTRDLIEEALNLDGLPLLLADTAGLRQADSLDEAEAQGMERSRAAVAGAELVLIVIDGPAGLDATARELLATLPPERRLLVLNKADLLSVSELASRQRELAAQPDGAEVAVISAKTGAGLAELKQKIKDKALRGADAGGREPLLTNIRHQQALRTADAALAEAIHGLTQGWPLDLLGIDLQNAYQALGEISGKTASEEVLTNIFANFCVGK